jgi:hypothetical protein
MGAETGSKMGARLVMAAELVMGAKLAMGTEIVGRSDRR